MYGQLEEERGLARHAMRIYERATRAVSDEDRLDMFNFYITKSASNFGLTSTRSIYERAIAALPDSEAKDMCLKFAEMERRLGEIDRARAIYGHASQFCDPRREPGFWQKWESFEVQHGNEDTFKDMLRIKRSVQAQYKYVSRMLNLGSFTNQLLVPTSALSPLRPSHEVNNLRLKTGILMTLRRKQMLWRPWSARLVRPLVLSQPALEWKVAAEQHPWHNQQPIRMPSMSTTTYESFSGAAAHSRVGLYSQICAFSSFFFCSHIPTLAPLSFICIYESFSPWRQVERHDTSNKSMMLRIREGINRRLVS
jgi:hypothetical protein